jgi:hypothetical protein
MSFIVDALKKSETDRQRQSVPALFEVKVAAPRRTSARAASPSRAGPASSVCWPRSPSITSG